MSDNSRVQASVGPSTVQKSNGLIRMIDRFMPEHILASTEDRKRQVRTAICFLMASCLMAVVF